MSFQSYDEPRRIKIKIPSDQYMVLHDWFGDHYIKLHDICEEGFDMVEIVSSPNMIVHWAITDDWNDPDFESYDKVFVEYDSRTGTLTEKSGIVYD